jgi:hypothetical protein
MGSAGLKGIQRELTVVSRPGYGSGGEFGGGKGGRRSRRGRLLEFVAEEVFGHDRVAQGGGVVEVEDQ